MDLILNTKDSHQQQEACEELSDARSINRQPTLEDFSSCFIQQKEARCSFSIIKELMKIRTKKALKDI